jgi:hypothetical protein
VTIFNTIILSNVIPDEWDTLLSISVLDNMLYQPTQSEDHVQWENLLSDGVNYCEVDRDYFDYFQLSMIEMGSLWLIYPFGIFLAGIVMLVLQNSAGIAKRKDSFYFDGFRAKIDQVLTLNMGNSFILFTKVSENMISGFYLPIINYKFKKLSAFINHSNTPFKEKLKSCRLKAIRASRGKKVRFEFIRSVLRFSRMIWMRRAKKMNLEKQLDIIG